jgi:hypothetical protein
MDHEDAKKTQCLLKRLPTLSGGIRSGNVIAESIVASLKSVVSVAHCPKG